MNGRIAGFVDAWRRWRKRTTTRREVLPDLEVVIGRRYLARGTHPDALDTVRVLTVYADEDPPYLYVWSEGQGKFGYLELERVVEPAPEADTDMHLLHLREV